MKFPWMPFYWGDYLTKTTHLNQGQHGAYMLLIAHYWNHEGELPKRPEQCYSIARASDDAERSNVDAVLDEFFPLKGGKRVNERADEELVNAEIAYTKRAGAANKRWENHPEQRRSKAPAMQLQPQPQKSIKKKKEKDTPGQLIDDGFVLPDWVPRADWDAWLDIRKKVKAANTDYALKLAVGKLATLRAQGHAPELVLRNAIEGSWKSLYPPKTDQPGHATAEPRYNPICSGTRDGQACTQAAVTWPGNRRNGFCRECDAGGGVSSSKPAVRAPDAAPVVSMTRDQALANMRQTFGIKTKEQAT